MDIYEKTAINFAKWVLLEGFTFQAGVWVAFDGDPITSQSLWIKYLKS